MSFGKAIQNANAAALGEFTLATEEFKEACRKFTYIRLALDKENATDAELAQYERARRVYKVACKVYTEARARYVSVIRQVVIEAPTITNDELYLIAKETNQRALTEAIRREHLEASITPEEREIVRQTMEERTNTKRKFLADSDDPTFGDFDPL